MAVSVLMPSRPQKEQQREGESDLDKVAKALNIAQSVYGIYTGYQGMQQDKERTALAKQTLDVNKQNSEMARYMENVKAEEKTRAEADKLAQTQTKETRQITSDLRKERSNLPVTRATQEVSAAFNKVQNAAEKPSAAGDLALIFNYMKMLDPGSTVREGEFANAQNAAGVPDRIANIYNRVIQGTRLGENQRADFLGQAQGIYKAQLSLQDQVDSKFRSIAEKYGLDPNDILLPFKALEKAGKQQDLPQQKPFANEQEKGFLGNWIGNLNPTPRANAKPKNQIPVFDEDQIKWKK